MLDRDELRTKDGMSAVVRKVLKKYKRGFVHASDGRSYMKAISSILRLAPVRAEDATSRRPADKETIDAFIRDELPGGFEHFNAMLTEKILQGAQEFVDTLV